MSADVVVIGGNGQLGSDIVSRFRREGVSVRPITHEDVEVSNPDAVASVTGDLRPRIIVNTAAYHQVPACEASPERAFAVNALGPLYLAKAAEGLGAVLVQISTDYVFDGRKGSPYLEEDVPGPLNVYAASKLAGESFVRAYCERHFIVRTSGLYGEVPCRAKGTNFVTMMLRSAGEKAEVRVVDDEVLTPTATVDVARQLWGLVQTAAYGLYHLTNEGACSWYEFAEVIFRERGLRTPLRRASSADFPSPIKRPRYSVLENGRLKALGMNQMPHWRDSLLRHLARLTG